MSLYQSTFVGRCIVLMKVFFPQWRNKYSPVNFTETVTKRPWTLLTISFSLNCYQLRDAFSQFFLVQCNLLSSVIRSLILLTISAVMASTGRTESWASLMLIRSLRKCWNHHCFKHPVDHLRWFVFYEVMFCKLTNLSFIHFLKLRDSTFCTE